MVKVFENEGTDEYVTVYETSRATAVEADFFDELSEFEDYYDED